MSSGSDSDEDYVPGIQKQLSEEESADEETEKDYEDQVKISKKRKSLPNINKNKKTKTSIKQSRVVEPEDDQNSDTETPVDLVEEKKKEDDLWAMFLGSTPASTKPKTTTVEKVKEPAKAQIQQPKSTKDEMKSREARIFEFAGEKILVEDDMIKDEPSGSLSASLATAGVPKVRPAGISNVLDQINKKTKLSTLEKTRLDWDTFKKKEGIEQEIKTFNKGKEGYLEKQDFLERADHRQFEIERDLRTGRRSNR